MLWVSELQSHKTRMRSEERRVGKECPTYLKSIGKSKALTATLGDTELEDDSDNEDDGILNATVIPTEGIVEDMDEEEELVESKFEKMDE